MKNLILAMFSLTFLVTAVSCNGNKANTSNETSDPVTAQKKVVPHHDIEQPLDVITTHEGKYPSQIQIFNDKNFDTRLKKLTGNNYEKMIRYFNVETPVVSENGIYKFTGCRQHNCPAFQTTILYDATNDNLNVLIDRNGTIALYSEKEQIPLTPTLKNK